MSSADGPAPATASVPATSFRDAVRLAVRLSWIDIRTQFTATPLGTGIHSAGYLLQVGLVGTLFAAILQKQLLDTQGYLVQLALGFAVWFWVSNSLTGAAAAPGRWGEILRATALSPAVFAAEVVLRQTLVFVQNLVLVLLVHLAVIGVPSADPAALAAGFLLILLLLLAAATIVATISIRFRDVPQVLTYAVQIGLLMTPILWPDYFLGSYQFLLPLNPLYWLVVVVREPILGIPVPLHIWLFTAGGALALTVVAVAVGRWARQRLTYWL